MLVVRRKEIDFRGRKGGNLCCVMVKYLVKIFICNNLRGRLYVY